VDLIGQAARIRVDAAYAESAGHPALWQHDMADVLEKRAEKLLAPAPDLSVADHGEVVPRKTKNRTNKQVILRDTLKTPDAIAQEASIRRTDLLLQKNVDVLSLAVDAAATCEAGNALEKMLAHQMALAHEMVMRIGNAAMGEVQQLGEGRSGLYPGQTAELQRLTNCAARLMTTYQQGMLALQRIKTGGNQVVTVQHVNVAGGGQAVIGNVVAGGKLPGGREES